ncbi:alpha/beta hydrolase [Cesiribacter sp. SM1]|uniref:alpha/beta hydrolase n=1 Tax=Cesiribacter sp. SM1 TaxID=2861196 RepID=UPI001CD73925|nr:alpha/beta hydrolase [Cesiribacter sp. SM1]
MRFLLLILLSFSYGAMAQEALFPRDTSYTFRSAYEKLHKEYPSIKAVDTAAPKGVAVRQNLVYRRLGNRALHLDMFYPATSRNADKAKKLPAVLMVHGGGWRTGDKSLVKPMAQQLAAAGYVTAAVEYRLSLEAPYPAAVHDLKAAIRWLRANAAEYGIDTSRIAVYGTSAGGQLAALIGTTNNLKKLEGAGDHQQHSSSVQAIIDVDGVLAFKHPESEEGTMAAQWLGGTYEEVPQNWQEASALTHVDKNTPPVLFISSSYPRFHAGRADMVKVLDREGIYHEHWTMPDSPHSFWLFHPWFVPTLQYTTNFLNKVFKQQ